MNQFNFSASAEWVLPIRHTANAPPFIKQKLLLSKTFIKKGDVVSKIKGFVTSRPTPCSIQLSKTKHLNDIKILGSLIHCCEPNCFIDTRRLNLLALKDIEKGHVLSINYYHTESNIYESFYCECDSKFCNGFFYKQRPGNYRLPPVFNHLIKTINK